MLHYLFKVAVLAGPLLRVLVMNDVQRSLPLLQLQTFDLSLQLIQLLLQVFALLHVLHSIQGQAQGQQGRYFLESTMKMFVCTV